MIKSPLGRSPDGESNGGPTEHSQHHDTPIRHNSRRYRHKNGQNHSHPNRRAFFTRRGSVRHSPAHLLGFRVLAFDGGGYRGYASLLILKTILRRVQPKGAIFPHEYFDLICGTSTGGLIAILLAVLCLDIDTALDVYAELGEEVFSNEWPRLRFLTHDAQFNSKHLREAIDDIVKRHGNGRRLMHDRKYNTGCLCFVTVTHTAGDNNNNIHICSYKDQSVPDGHKWTIQDAALATSAAPTYFKPHRIKRGANTFTFEDSGAHGVNNPAEEAMYECERLGVARYGYFLSIGTGRKGLDLKKGHKERGKFRRVIQNVFTLHGRVTRHAYKFAREATDVTAVENRMARKAQGPSKFPYYRFNPEDLGAVPMADRKAIPRMEFGVNNFFSNLKNEADLDLCGARIAKVMDKRQSWWWPLWSRASRYLHK